MSAFSSTPPARRGRLVLLALAALFLLPVLAAVFLNSRWTDWQPAPTRNYGALLRPATPIPAELEEALALAPEWTLVTAPPSCTGGCGALTDRLARLDRALGRHAGEVRQVLLTPARDPAVTSPAVDHRATPAAWSPFLAGLAERSTLAGPPGALLIDPRGNAVLAYPESFDAGRVRKDLDRLLRYSRFDES